MATLKLEPGKFYKSRQGDVWCCYEVRADQPLHAQANCIHVQSHGHVEYFFLDGRYDSDGNNGHCLVEECGPDGSPLVNAGTPQGLNSLRDEALRIAVSKGFTDATVGEDLMLMVTELAEAMEDFRAKKPLNEMMYERAGGGGSMLAASIVDAARLFGDKGTLPKPVGFPSEMADVIIRVLHFCGKHGINLEKAVEEKMAYNATRAFKHGGKAV